MHAMPTGSLDPENQHPLNFIARIRGASDAEVRARFEKLHFIVTRLVPDPLNGIGTVHFGRFLFLDPVPDPSGTWYRTLAVFTAYDGDFERYVQDFVNHTGSLFDAILPLVDSPEGLVPVQRNAQGFARYLDENGRATRCRFYSHVPELSALQIRGAARGAGISVGAGSFDPQGQGMLSFFAKLKGSTSCERQASSEALHELLDALDAEPLRELAALHFARVLLRGAARTEGGAEAAESFGLLTDHDDDVRACALSLVDALGPFLDRALPLLDGPVQALVPTAREREALADELTRSSVQCGGRLYANYPGLRAAQVRAFAS
jgi:hypothetical protein